MKVPFNFVNKLNPSVIAAQLDLLDVGDKDSQIVARVQQALGLLAVNQNGPKVHSVSGWISESAPATITFKGENFLPTPLTDAAPVAASKRFFESGSDYLEVSARTPGAIGNSISIEFNTPAGAFAIVESGASGTLNPVIVITPHTNPADTETGINNDSTFLSASLSGTPTQSSLAATKLEGGQGPGPRVSLDGSVLLDGYTVPATDFGTWGRSPNGSFIEKWTNTEIKISIHNSDISTTAGDVQHLLLQWLSPLCEVNVPGTVVA